MAPMEVISLFLVKRGLLENAEFRLGIPDAPLFDKKDFAAIIMCSK